jgi:hypothetical protein
MAAFPSGGDGGSGLQRSVLKLTLFSFIQLKFYFHKPK